MTLFGRNPVGLVALCPAFQTSLALSQGGLRLLQMSGVGDTLVAVGESGKVGDADIYSDIIACFGKRFCLDLTSDADIPPIGLTRKGHGLWRSLKGTMDDSSNAANFREVKRVATEFGSGTISRIGERAKASFSLEPRKSCPPSLFDTPEEVTVGFL